MNELLLNCPILLLRLLTLLAAFWLAYGLFSWHPRVQIMLCRAVSVGFPLLVLIHVLGFPTLLKVSPPQMPTLLKSEHVLVSEDLAPVERPRLETTADTSPVLEQLPGIQKTSALEPHFKWSLNQLIVLGWGAGSVVLLTLLGCGIVRFEKLIRSLPEAPERVREIVREVAKALQLKSYPQVKIMESACSPAVGGCIQKILLPPFLLLENNIEDLRAALAHELVHVRERDWFWSQWLHLLTIIFWPLLILWPLRWAYHRAAEVVCDAEASSQSGGTQNYAESLARQSLWALEHFNSPALPMFRKSGVRRRLERMLSGFRPRPLSKEVESGGGAVIVGILLLLAGVQWAISNEASPVSPGEPLTIQCLDPDKNPVSGAEVYLVEYLKNYTFGETEVIPVHSTGPFLTDKEGKVLFKDVITYGKNEWRRMVYARLPGKWAGGVYSENSPEKERNVFPESSLKLSLLPTMTVRGKVGVPQGFPITKIQVFLLGWSAKENKESFFGTLRLPGVKEPWPSIVEFSTNDKGDFEIPDVPKGCNLYVSSNAPGLGEAQVCVFGINSQTLSMAMQAEGVIQGSIVDPEGKALNGVLVYGRVSGANMSVLHEYWGRTDERGRYEIKGLPQAAFQVTSRPPNGWVSMPKVDIMVRSGEKLNLNFICEEGTWIEGSLKDAETKKGIQGVGIAFLPGDMKQADAYASVKTNEKGNFRIKLPKGESTSYYFSYPADRYEAPERQGMRLIRVVPDKKEGPLLFELMAKATNQQIPELSPRAIFKGRVVDEQGKPMANIPLYGDYKPGPGVDSIEQNSSSGLSATDGSYSLEILSQGSGRVYAGGITTSSAKSKIFKTVSGAINQVEDLIVKPAGSTFSGIVLDEKDRPVPNVSIRASSKNKYNFNWEVKTDLAGKFVLPHLLENEPFSLEMLCPGYAFRSFYDLKPGGKDLVFKLLPSKKEAQHSSSPNDPARSALLEKPAPEWKVGQWIQVKSENPSPKRPDGRWTLLAFLRGGGTSVEKLQSVLKTAEQIGAEPVAIYESHFHESVPKGFLSATPMSINVAIDEFTPNQGSEQSATRDAYGELFFRYFLIDSKGIVKAADSKLENLPKQLVGSLSKGDSESSSSTYMLTRVPNFTQELDSKEPYLHPDVK